MKDYRIHIKVDEATHSKATQQANKLGLTVSEYIRLIIELDSATGLIEKLQNNK